jgi:arylsulfatase A-like enzyme
MAPLTRRSFVHLGAAPLARQAAPRTRPNILFLMTDQQRFFKLYEDSAIPRAQVGAWAAKYEGRNSERDDIWRGRLPDAEIRRSRQACYGSISHVDEQIGRVLEALERRGWLEQTMIVFTSDHGDMTGDQVGPHSDDAARDVLPTFLDAASAHIPEHLDGRSLLELVRTEGRGWREYIDRTITGTHSLTVSGSTFITRSRVRSSYSISLAIRMSYTMFPARRKSPTGGRLVPRPAGLMTSPHFPRATAR